MKKIALCIYLFFVFPSTSLVKKDIDIHDAPVQLADLGLEGKHLSIEQLEQLKKGTLIKTEEQKLTQLKTKAKKIDQDQQTINALTNSIDTYKKMKQYLYWHQSIPTTGLRLKSPWFPPPYPFMPHFFSLWQLAPRKGKGVKVSVIDTGIAGFALKGEYAYKKNIDLMPQRNFQKHNFNLVNRNGFEQLLQVIQQYIIPNKFNKEALEQILPLWIQDYILYKKTDQIKHYLKKYGKKELWKNGALSAIGRRALEMITVGDYGIAPKDQASTFTIKELLAPVKENIIMELLPVPKITQSKTTLIAGHGSHTFGLIGAQLQGKLQKPEKDTGVVGLAPYAEIFMIKAFKDSGLSDKSTLITAIKSAIMHDVQVVNLSLKIADNLDLTSDSTKLLQQMVGLVPYMVAASGNSGFPRTSGYAGEVEAYPARFDSVAFDVGAFQCDGTSCSISLFSQYEPGIGPKFVAPGFNILSTGLIPNQTEDTQYVFLSGTSMAASIMSGFITLMLSEFQHNFTREQLIKVCYKSTIKLQDTPDWQKKVLLGVLDMRTALLILHALRDIKQKIKNQVIKYPFDKQFNNIVQAVYTIVFAPVQDYSKKQLGNVDFTNNFMGYFNKAKKQEKKFKQDDYFIPQTIDEAVVYITNSIKEALNPKQKEIEPKAPDSVIKKVAQQLKQKDLNLFTHLGTLAQKRITVVQKAQTYWQQQAKK